MKDVSSAIRGGLVFYPFSPSVIIALDIYLQPATTLPSISFWIDVSNSIDTGTATAITNDIPEVHRRSFDRKPLVTFRAHAFFVICKFPFPGVRQPSSDHFSMGFASASSHYIERFVEFFHRQ